MKKREKTHEELDSKLKAALKEMATDEILPELREELIKGLIDRLKKEERALVFSAVPLTNEEKIRLHEILSRLLKRPIKIQNLVDKRLLGGFKVIIGDWKFDGTLSYLLATLKEEICQI